ncbi:MAG: hypothetical protein BWY15_00432 [Firmicutes bacterium ADurb.Bin193]|nr:MAG: hypothetical protein BWY15_00432 [Firmicutes bacterium ADurb.Bin193]
MSKTVNTDPKVDPVDPNLEDPNLANPVPADSNPADPPAPSFTQEDIDAAVAAAQEKWKKDQEEQARLGKLSEEERKKEELASKEKKLLQKELLLKATDLLSEKALPVKFKDFLVGADEKTTESNITAFEQEWKAALAEAVNERLKGTTPKAGEGAPEVTKEQFAKMSYKERLQLFNQDKAAYDRLMKGE